MRANFSVFKENNMKKVFVMLLLVLAACSKKPVYIRYEIHSTEAKPHVEALNVALDSMRAMDCNNPLSWYYQGAMHWVPDTVQTNPLCPSYRTVADLKTAWDNCTHSHEGTEKIHFLVWHRMYIWHFEKIVRKLSGYDQFALPYWGYTDNQLVLQETFRNSASSLFEAARFDSLNAGYPLSGEILRALDLTKLMSYETYEEFNSHMNAAPHGAMHDYIGHGNIDPDTTKKDIWNRITNSYTSDGLMGWVPTAGFDPVFWTHHSQIDRLWQKWSNSPNGKAVTLEVLKSHPWPYIFFDENGNQVEYTPEQIVDIIYNLDYKFDDVILHRPPTSEAFKVQAILPIEDVEVNIPVNDQITDAVTIGLDSVPKNKVTLHLTMKFDDRPSGVYEVYVNNSNNTYLTTDSSFAGYMSFFEGHNTNEMTFKFKVSPASLYNLVVYKHNGNSAGNLRIINIRITK